MFDNLLVLWLAALPLMGSPGPATLSLAGIGAAFGGRNGIRYLAGIVLGTSGVLFMIATGVTGLVLAEPAVIAVLTIVAAAYILYLAWKIATAPVLSRSDPAAPPPSFSAGFVLAIANPKAFAAIGAVYSGNTVVEDALLPDSVAKVLALFAVIVVVNTAWLFFGSSFSRFLGHPTAGRIANMTFGLMLLVSVLVVFLDNG